LRHGNVCVTQPVLNGSDVDAAPQRPRCKRIAELVKPEVGQVRPRLLRHSLAEAKEVTFHFSFIGREYEPRGWILLTPRRQLGS